MRRVYLSYADLMGYHMYSVMVDGNRYDQFYTDVPLTVSECVDVANYYAEALDIDNTVPLD